MANKLDKKYKDLVLGSVMILLFLSFTAFSLLYVGKIDIKILLYLGLVVEVFYAMPRVVIGFHRLYAQPLGSKTFLAFIPHLNYVICLNKVLFILCNILAGLFVIFALPQIVNTFYYNPGKEVSDGTNQMSLDMAVYTPSVFL